MKEQVSLEMSKECGRNLNLKKPRLFPIIPVVDNIRINCK